MSRTFIGLLLFSFRKGGLDNHGLSGLRLRTTRLWDATRSHAAMRGHCTTEDEPGTASYDMLVQPTDSLVLFVFLREPACTAADGGGCLASRYPARNASTRASTTIQAVTKARNFQAPAARRPPAEP